MPTHCSNCLIIRGPDHERQYVLDTVLNTNDQFDLRLIPSLENTCETNWDCYETHLEHGYEIDKIYFQTVGCPYSETIQKMLSAHFPRVQFELLFAEQGKRMCGRYKSSYDNFTGTVCFMKQDVPCNPTRICKDNCEDQCDVCEFTLDDPVFNELYQTSG